MSVLVPCPGCSRHVRSAEEACPFCGKDLPTNLSARAVPSASKRMDRFATFTFAAALAIASTTGVGCSGAVDDEGDKQQQTEDELRKKKKKDGGAADAAKDTGCSTEDPGGIVAMYGMPPGPWPQPTPCGADAGPQDDGGVQAMYGLPPTPEEDGGAIAPMYGLPFPLPEEDGGGIQPMYGMPAGNN